MLGQPVDKDASHSTTILVLLGTGTPNADPDRAGPAAAVVVDSVPYLVDCGPGIVRRAAAAHERGVSVLAVKALNRVFVTHLHSDHTLGLPDLILSPWVLERESPLHVYGPVGTRTMVEHILAAYEPDIRARIDGPEPANQTGWQAVVHEVEPGTIYRDERATVHAFAVDHGPMPAFGYRFDAPDRTIVFSGDTAPTEAIVEQAAGCDVLVHEVYSTVGLQSRPPEWQRYHRAVHTSARELGELAARIHPGLLVLTHQLLWGISDEDLLDEIREAYDGKVLLGRDPDTL